MTGRRAAAVATAALLLTVGTAGAAYAVFSGKVGSSQRVEAATVVLSGSDEAPPDLQYRDLRPGTQQTDELALHYAGTVAADLYLDIVPEGGTPFCRADLGGRWEPMPGGALEIRVRDGAWISYCSLLDGDRSLPLMTGVAPGTDLDIGVDVRLRPGSDDRYSELSDGDGLRIDARESGAAAGFSDQLRGNIEISTGVIGPTIPPECIDAGLVDFDADNTVHLTEGNDVYEAPKQPQAGRGFLIFGHGGDDSIIGSNQADCIDGGAGDDELWGANQGDVVIGGSGDDVLHGSDDKEGQAPQGNGKDLLYGGEGSDRLYGGNAHDELHGENGDDILFGDRGTDIWDGGPDVSGDICVDMSGIDDAHGDRFLDCESIVGEPPA